MRNFIDLQICTELFGFTKHCAIGYNEFDFILENADPDPVMGAKFNSKIHLLRTFLFF